MYNQQLRHDLVHDSAFIIPGYKIFWLRGKITSDVKTFIQKFIQYVTYENQLELALQAKQHCALACGMFLSVVR